MGQEKGKRKGETKEEEEEKLMSAGGTGLEMFEPQFHMELMEAKSKVSLCHESDWKIVSKSGSYSNPTGKERTTRWGIIHSHWTNSKNGSYKDC